MMTRLLPIPEVTLGGKYEKKTIKLETSIDKRNFKVCEPKEIRKRHYLIMETIHIVHVLRNGQIRMWEVK